MQLFDILAQTMPKPDLTFFPSHMLLSKSFSLQEMAPLSTKNPKAILLLNNNNNRGLAACCHKSQTCEADAGVKEERFYSGAAQSGRMADSCLKAHLLCNTKTQTSTQSSCSKLKCSPLELLGSY